MPAQADRTYDIQSKAQDLARKSESLSLDDLNGRRELLNAAYALCHELESPMEAIFRTVVIQPVLLMTVRIAVDLDLFTVMARPESYPRTATTLAPLVNADPVILGRLLKQMAAMDFIREVGPGGYELNAVSQAMLNPAYRDGFPFCHDVLGPSFQATVQYLAETRYQNPSNLRDSPFQLGHRTKKTFFEWLAMHPDHDARFNNFMGMYANGRPRWLDPGHFPIREVLGESAQFGEDDPVLLVDVGGGKGHDLVLLKNMYPDLKGRMILQDIPFVIKQAGVLPDGLESMVYDFFTPQPIVGARAYYFHSVLHGWPDEKCLQILSNIKTAMKPGYSKLLINEIVVADENAHHLSTSMDLLMMTVVSAEERTASSWHRILPMAGFKIVKIWDFEIGTESIIEAELAEEVNANV